MAIAQPEIDGALTSWRRYVEKQERLGLKPQAKFSRFRARFIVAKNLSALSIQGVSDATTEAYRAALRVTLAYTALEALENAIGCKNQIKIDDENLSNLIRHRHLRMVTAINTSISAHGSTGLRISLSNFIAGKSNDLLPFVYGLRNLMAHGQFTPTHFGLIKAPLRIKLVHDIADTTLEVLDQRFTAYVRKL